MSQIGIKLANHDFFPIIDNISSLPIEKEVELTTVRDAQATVQINLFCKDEKISYIGTLMIEDLKETACGDASILLTLHLDKEKNLRAQAVDKNTGNKQSFSISIEELDQNNLSDFDFNTDELFLKDMTSSSIDDIDLSFTDIPLGDDEKGEEEKTEEANEKNSQNDVNFSEEPEYFLPSEKIEEVHTNEENSYKKRKVVPLDEDYLTALSMCENKKSFPTWLKIFLVVLVICVLALIIALFLKDTFRRPKKTSSVENIEILEKIERKEETPTIDTLTTEPPKKEAEPFLQEEKEVVIEKTEEDDVLQEDSVKKEVAHDVVKKVEGGAIGGQVHVRYRLRPGDTLWDLAENFYKNPWQYKKIARYNGIKNPNYIMAGRYITIPAK